ncbi:AMP-binding protein, partial [Actinophytocola sp.]|uniref:AMP-binding protein n=1 Tax=Actinophytocola sp. TaxID=1872138 RepID=UPI002D9B1403|nr:AMP-binding protein [Actinophytocola sp.]
MRVQPDRSWTVGGPDCGPDEGLHETLARLARRRPGAAALVSGSRTVTYAELDRAADAWAARLTAAGAGPGRVVPILLPRCTELVTALLAVLKTGAAYALLDPDWPAERIDDLLSVLAPPVVVDRPVGPFPPSRGFTPATVRAADPCCVFLTSGTTGTPKAVLTPHRAIARLFGPHGFARFTATSVMPLAAPGPWDAFALELWSVLLGGGTSVLVTEPYLSAHALRDGVARHGVDTAWLTSSLFNLAVDEDPDAFTGLRQVMIGGERLCPDHVARFLRRHPTIVLLNGYGPVESTVFATTHRITAADCARPDGIPLGRPVPGTRVLVLAGDRMCAVGEPGEICLAGSGLAIGYLGDPERTAERFGTVLLDGAPVRVYRTGDIGVWGADGLLRFRGRADRQVKVRGHRVEPAEVEAQIRRLLPEVADCRVLSRRDPAGLTDELVAFCVPAAPAGAPDRLAKSLLPHHRPAAVVGIPAFPVTDRGKLNEPALLALAHPTPP